MRTFHMIINDERAVEFIDHAKYILKSRLSTRDTGEQTPIADALNEALNKIIKDFGLDWDPHTFARLPVEENDE